jgi:hypothetical protein
MSEGLHAKMSVLAWRKSTSTTSYFGSRVELILNGLPSGVARSRGTSFVCSAASKLALTGQLLQVHNKHLIERQGLGVLNALNVIVECVLDRRAHGDDVFWPRHLHLEVSVVRDSHELSVARTLKDGMVRVPKPHHLEGEGLLVEIFRRAEPDRQIDLSEELDALAWRDAMEGRRAGPQLVQPNPHQP